MYIYKQEPFFTHVNEKRLLHDLILHHFFLLSSRQTREEKAPYMQSNIPLCILYIINNPLTDFLCSIFLTSFNLNFRCTHIPVE